MASLPVAIGGAPGKAIDVSASGIYIETQVSHTLGSPVSVALDLDTPWGKVVIQSQGTIVRIEQREEKIGVAVQFMDGGAACRLGSSPH